MGESTRTEVNRLLAADMRKAILGHPATNPQMQRSARLAETGRLAQLIHRIMSLSDRCFKPLSFGVLCYAAKAN